MAFLHIIRLSLVTLHEGPFLHNGQRAGCQVRPVQIRPFDSEMQNSSEEPALGIGSIGPDSRHPFTTFAWPRTFMEKGNTAGRMAVYMKVSGTGPSDRNK